MFGSWQDTQALLVVGNGHGGVEKDGFSQFLDGLERRGTTGTQHERRYRDRRERKRTGFP